jgi:phosphatidate cytidylyltransferase
MKTRAITGIFFVAVMLGSFYAGSIVFSVFYGLLALLCLQEYYGVLNKAGLQPNAFAGILNGLFIYGAFAASFYLDTALIHKIIFLLVLPLLSVFVLELYQKAANPFANIGYTFLGLIFAILPFTFFHALAFVTNGPFNFHIPLAFLLMLWANDTGAYLVGRQFGRTKLFERHSPKKTWEGFIGGILIAAAVGYIISIYFHELPWRNWVSVGVIIGMVGTLGDLVESMFKRSLNIKDSGGLLPGHGGLLDRFDGLLLAAPVVFVYLYLIFN